MRKWRLKKHAKMHTRQFVQSCQYFNNGNKCPYEKLGCKFLNVVTEMCKYGKKCHKRLCPQRHDEQKVNTDNLTSLGDEHCNENEEKNDSDASFVTSTPQKTVFQCEECEENRQCTDCFVMQHVETEKLSSNRKRKVHSMSHSGETC